MPPGHDLLHESPASLAVHLASLLGLCPHPAPHAPREDEWSPHRARALPLNSPRRAPEHGSPLRRSSSMRAYAPFEERSSPTSVLMRVRSHRDHVADLRPLEPLASGLAEAAGVLHC